MRKKFIIRRDVLRSHQCADRLEQPGLYIVGFGLCIGNRSGRAESPGKGKRITRCRCGQGCLVVFAVTRDWQLGKSHKHSRDHVVGKHSGQELTQHGGRERGIRLRHKIRDQTGVLRRRTSDHDAAQHLGITVNRNHDLFRLDAIAADLHLVVDASEERDLTARKQTRAISRPVESSADEWIGDEFLRRQFGAIAVSAAHAGAADAEFSGLARQDGS